ncbi:hypothetical protein DRE_07709 [Drechslerella stenobrocha 248]|uniref:C3H1-type domain-containing protein n=1 Tax=Drechslerella stenobrocha 248 TaxID=1043628 RepID=W7HSD0_9PEZI|nr:hypothetical protein DRE_07709 [Drechslerella stenobrocha 248]
MALFDDGDAALLKKWVVNRLENISDADSDVLADYVLALLRHDQSENEVRQMCVDQLDDFLREYTAAFVNELFATLRSKSYLSVNSSLYAGLAIATTTPPATTAPVHPSNDDGDSEGSYAPKSPEVAPQPAAPFAATSQNNGYSSAPAPAQSKKRGYYDRDAPGAQDRGGQYSSNSRTKNPKVHTRGGARGNASSDHNGRWTRGGGDFGRNGAPGPQQGHQSRAPMPPQQAGPYPMGMLPGPVGLPLGGPPLPFAADPMAQLLAVQAVAAAHGGGAMFHPPPGIIPKENRLPKRGVCHSYEQKGYCKRGDACPYLHAGALVVPPTNGQTEGEYDPHTPMLSPQDLERRTSISFPAKPPQPSRGGGNHRGSRGGANNRGARSEFSGFGPTREANKALVVECIPDEKLDEQSVRGYFSTFGAIESVEVKLPKKLAILKFENHEDAKKAHGSPDPIFNNRFVKVYWMKSEEGNGQHQHQHQQSNDAQQRPEEMEIDMEDFQRKQTEAQKAYEEKQAKKKEIDDQAKQLEDLQADLLRRQEEEKKKLLAKLAKKHAAKNTANGAASQPEPSDKGVKDAHQTAALKAQLEALEAEATSLGIDHSKPDEALPDFHSSAPYNRGRGSLRARGGFGPYSTRAAYIPRGAATMSKKLTLDNRTKTVMVNGVSDDGIEALQQFMLACGSQYTHLEKNTGTENSQLITFNTRGDAARFYHATPMVPQIGKIEVSWVEAGTSAAANGDAAAAAPMHDVEMDAADAAAGFNDSAVAGNGFDGYDLYDMADDDDSRWT